MYIKYKGKEENSFIVNVNLGSCEKISVEENKLIISFPKNSKEELISFNFNSNEEANKALTKLFMTLYFKAPAGNLLDLESLEITEEIITEEKDVEA